MYEVTIQFGRINFIFFLLRIDIFIVTLNIMTGVSVNISTYTNLDISVIWCDMPAAMVQYILSHSIILVVKSSGVSIRVGEHKCNLPVFTNYRKLHLMFVLALFLLYG